MSYTMQPYCDEALIEELKATVVSYYFELNAFMLLILFMRKIFQIKTPASLIS